MNKKFLVILLCFISSHIFSQDIIGTWYRTELYSKAELTISSEMDFSIDATNNANFGNIEGNLIKIKDGYYYTHIADFDQGCVILFIEHKDNIEVIVYGDQIGAGSSVYYDGKYEEQPLTKEEEMNRRLDYIVESKYDKNKLKELLGSDLEYFIECFGTRFIEKNGNTIIIDGWMRGVAPWQNGIIKIQNDNIYILITDCRDSVLKYYTNDIFNKTIPDEFKRWEYYQENIVVIDK
ncbi:hypothetical protein [Breznakiella homolactica]|uniref:Lipocalin-like domain-containing protein n=1 Tax=Breznakiella homolactica TaxID=2798577 RepID=A0A7T8BBG0_9SPIR|nr:hypothetical protein [Breznakiella homolactica]QQO10371.1 hypothetical protein JFL75_05485 [Breznakiella homolactica]